MGVSFSANSPWLFGSNAMSRSNGRLGLWWTFLAVSSVGSHYIGTLLRFTLASMADTRSFV